MEEDDDTYGRREAITREESRKMGQAIYSVDVGIPFASVLSPDDLDTMDIKLPARSYLLLQRHIHMGSTHVIVVFQGRKEETVIIDLLKIVDPNHITLLLPNSAKQHDRAVNYAKAYAELQKMKLIETDESLLHVAVSIAMKANTNPKLIHTRLIVGERLSALTDDEFEAKGHTFSFTAELFPTKIRIIRPLLRWSYDDVWSYIADKELRHCDLYARGYSELKLADEMSPNYRLEIEIGQPVYDPDYIHAAFLYQGKY